ncbi:BNR repeat-containing protein [uncultured Erythrobacter sp.]|uniref:BNR repeat-containing protein n=1 Tax=uncultured Erythrobacter sp. TaxID=263913 RepID=UPI00260B989D|nr:BNR repeat-containing protein [uncultured Erythrobacter sp.]
MRGLEKSIRATLLVALFSFGASQPALAQPSEKLADEQLNLASEVEAIDFTWSGHRVFAQMIQRGDHQIIAYYDANRQMSIAHRAHQRTPWRYQKVPSFVGWDSHNYVTVDVDEDGYIHVMGNMHNDPLVYFRSTQPWNVRSLKQVDFMIDPERDTNVTYPRFMHDRDGRLIAIYRLGGSGNGRYYYHRYDTDTKTWSLMHDGQFFDGEDERGAYYTGPVLGPDGMFHIVWVWRETPSAATNNNLSYVRSPDLENWEDSNGNPVTLPLIRSTGEIVDPVPAFGGMLNGQKKIGFDVDNRPMISYYKNDETGDTQIMLARKSGDGWTIHQISDWSGSKQFLDRGGSLSVSILVPEDPYIADDGTIRVRAKRDGQEIEFVVDPATNRTLEVGSYKSTPDVIGTFQQNPELVQFVRKAEGTPPESAYDFYLSWEANPPAQDQARGEIPAPSTLRLHKIPR